jgi:hypothetical protein
LGRPCNRPLVSLLDCRDYRDGFSPGDVPSKGSMRRCSPDSVIFSRPLRLSSQRTPFSYTWLRWKSEDGRWKRLAIPGLRWKMEEGSNYPKTNTFLPIFLEENVSLTPKVVKIKPKQDRGHLSLPFLFFSGH